MNRLAVYAAVGLTAVMSAAWSYGQEIETFDSPNTAMIGGGNYAWAGPPSTSWTTFGGGNSVDNPTNVELTSTTGYGTAYHSFFAQDTSPVVSVNPNGILQLDITVVSGDVGPFIQMTDGEGDQWQWFYGYGLVGSGNAAPQETGETITELGNNELLLDVPLSNPQSVNSASFDYSQIVNFRFSDDPGGNPTYDIQLNDLSVVAAPEPASLSLAAFGLVLAARRRRA
ncbi:MAG TPA: PEP-CTERM sorting domain-containing protein [Tepidisphaeraceae bacterium]|jgi:hypothetical protein